MLTTQMLCLISLNSNKTNSEVTYLWNWDYPYEDTNTALHNLTTLGKPEETSIRTLDLQAKTQTQALLHKRWYPLYPYF